MTAYADEFTAEGRLENVNIGGMHFVDYFRNLDIIYKPINHG